MQQQFRERIAAAIARSGAFIQFVLPDLESGLLAYAYTVGLTERNLPELLVIGLEPNAAANFLRLAAAEIQDHQTNGSSISDGLVGRKILEGASVVFRELPLNDASSKWALFANSYYGRNVPIMQVVWPDEEHRFPWNPRCARDIAIGQSMILDFTKEG